MRSLILFLTICLYNASALAENSPLACQEVASAGLQWRMGKWQGGNFQTEKFILFITPETNLTTRSVSKAIFGTEEFSDKFECSNVVSRGGIWVHCFSKIMGATLMFNPIFETGSISMNFGNIYYESEDKKDSLKVSAFTCEYY